MNLLLLISIVIIGFASGVIVHDRYGLKEPDPSASIQCQDSLTKMAKMICANKLEIKCSAFENEPIDESEYK